jgi:hypothetical protein
MVKVFGDAKENGIVNSKEYMLHKVYLFKIKKFVLAP